MKRLTILIYLVVISTCLYPQNESEYCEMCWIKATIIDSTNSCIVKWSGQWEESFDDGTAENYFAWIVTGGMTAVKYPYYLFSPIRIVGGKIYVGDGSYPEGADFIGKQFRMCVFDDDGTNGLPNTLLDSITVTVENYNWVSFEGLDITINEGFFYMAMEQLFAPPDSPPVGIDEENPVWNRSYTKVFDGEWQLSSYQDFMIRQIYCEPEEEMLKKRMANSNLTGFLVALVYDFDPDIGEEPEDGTLKVLDSGIYMHSYYEFEGWDTLSEGYYAFAVKNYCPYGGVSGWEYTDTIYKNVTAISTVEVDKHVNTYPNPFSDNVTIEYYLSSPQAVSVVFYDQFGKLVDKTVKNQQTGLNQIIWRPENLDIGVYFYTLQAGEEVSTGKLLLMK